MPWYGLNFDDAIVANERLRGLFSYLEEEHFSRFIPPFYKKVEDSNDRIRFEDLSTRHEDIVINLPPGAELIETRSDKDDNRLGYALKWTVRTNFPFSVGDKLMARHGNKGVASVLLPSGQMPRLPEDSRLGDLSGRSVDLLLNPHGVFKNESGAVDRNASGACKTSGVC